MDLADWVAEVFHQAGIERVFLYPGGTIAPLINACIKTGIAVECFKSEQGAGYAALAYARVTGRPQVVMVTSGPGVTNVISCIADAYYDSTPLIIVTGQIGTGDLRVRQAVRQRGFQETQTVAITSSISKKSVCLMSPDEVFRDVPDAFGVCSSGRKGPVVLDFPMDMQRMDISARIDTPAPLAALPVTSHETEIAPSTMQEVLACASRATRPVILLGQGALDAACFEAYARMADAIGAMVMTSFLGIGSHDTRHPHYLGYIGHTGHQAANTAVHECDFLIVLGSRLDVRQTGTLTQEFVPNGKVAWVNHDPTELDNPRVSVQWKIQQDVATFCTRFLEGYAEKQGPIDEAWRQKLRACKLAAPEDMPGESLSGLSPRPVLDRLRQAIGDAAVTVVTGVGCHQHWAARHLAFRPVAARLLTSGGHGTMGYDLPSAIGAAIAEPDRQVLCVVGDGSFLMNLQELGALQERNLNVKILVMNNSRLGIVSQFQKITWDTDPTTGLFKSPDFVTVAHGFGIPAERLSNAADTNEKIETFWRARGPRLLEVTIDPTADIVPMLLAGQKMNDMWTGTKS